MFTKGQEDEDSVMCFSSCAGGVSELEQKIIKRRRTICQYDCQLWAMGLDGLSLKKGLSAAITLILPCLLALSPSCGHKN